MRAVTPEELQKIGGGLIKKPNSKLSQILKMKGFSPDMLPPVTVTAPTSGYGNGHGGGGGGVGGGGGPSPPVGGGGNPAPPPGTLSTGATVGLARIKADLGLDLTAYAKESVTLADEIDTAVNTWNWSFAFEAGNSNAAAPDASGIGGTININSADANNINAVVQQLSHELGHVDHFVYDDATKVTSQQFVSDYLTGEGYATMTNEIIQHQIMQSTNNQVDIGIATGNKQFALPMYNSDYQQFISGGTTLMNAAITAGNTYGAYEYYQPGITYTQLYENLYKQDGGTH